MVMIPIAIILGIIQASMITNCDSDDDYYVRFIAFLVPLSFEVILFGTMHDVIKLNAVFCFILIWFRINIHHSPGS